MSRYSHSLNTVAIRLMNLHNVRKFFKTREDIVSSVDKEIETLEFELEELKKEYEVQVDHSKGSVQDSRDNH